MKTSSNKKWKNTAYNEVDILDDDGEISKQDLEKIREFIDTCAVEYPNQKANDLKKTNKTCLA